MLDAAMQSENGALLNRIGDLDFMLSTGFTITQSDITVSEFEALRILHAERAKEQERRSHGNRK